MSEVSLLPIGEELDGFGAKDGGDLLTELSQGSKVEEAYDLAIVEWASWLLCRQR